MNEIDQLVGKIIDNRYKILEKIGGGDSGTVYRVLQVSLNLERALKVFDPKLLGVLSDDLEKTFNREINLLRQLSKITHRNIVKILDAGKIKVGEKQRPYYVMELVSPSSGNESTTDLNDFFAQASSKEQILDVLDQLFDGIAYLHHNKILHCDIKPSNVLLEIRPQSSYEVRITDLGVSKAFVSKPENGTQTYLFGSPSYAPAYSQRIINKNIVITGKKLMNEYFPHFDLFCLGATLVECISIDKLGYSDRRFNEMLTKPKTSIMRIFSPKDYELLVKIIKKLIQDNKDQCYKNISEVRADFIKLRNEYLWPLNVQEMAVGGAFRSLTQPRGKVFVSERAYRLIKHPVFQRLHNLNQLNFVYLLYSGARHSRFLHSMTAFETAKRYIEGLIADTNFKFLMNKHDYELFLASALLHDIGHYPLAHALEDLHIRGSDSTEPIFSRDYEMASYFLDLKTKDGLPTLTSILENEWNIGKDEILRIITKKGGRSETESLINSMIDGVIDIDKVSYLVDDSFFTGASFGLGIDLEALYASLAALPADVGEDRRAQIGISEKGIAPAESIISARYGMFTRVYWHHSNRAIMAMLKYAATMCFFSEYKTYNFSDYIKDTLYMSDIEALRLINTHMEVLVKNLLKKGTSITNPLTGLLDGQRSIYSRLVTYHAKSDNVRSAKIHSYLLKIKQNDLYLISEEISKIVGETLGISQMKLGDILIDVPQTDKNKDMLEPLWVDREVSTQRYKELANMSGLIQAVYQNFQKLVKKCRIYIRPDLWEKYGNPKILTVLKNNIGDFLEEQANKV